jgi:hypothetical protein
LLFVCGVVRVKSIRVERDVDRSPLLFICVGSLTVCAIDTFN